MMHRKTKEKNFTCIDNEILRDKEISYKAKGIFVYMMSCDDEGNFSIDGIANFSDDGRKAVNSGLKELEKAGYLDRYSVHINGRLEGVYDLYESKYMEKTRMNEKAIIEDLDKENVRYY